MNNHPKEEMKKRKKLLFILKKHLSSGGYGNVPKAGLYNSAKMTSDELRNNFNVVTNLEIAVDANCIDKYLHKYRPDYCVIEAIWVTPCKLKELSTLHPEVKFIIRIHSEIPFITNEGNAVDWIIKYGKMKNVFVAFNSREPLYAFSQVEDGHYTYLPNIYEKIVTHITGQNFQNKTVDVGCFGAIRPLKNQLIQAFAAVAFGNKYGKVINFHMNTGRVEQGGESTLKNIKALFDGSKHKLIQHQWLSRENFLYVVSKMNVGMQLSFSESFNIVSADFVAENVPVIVSDTISWMPEQSMTSTENVKKIVDKLHFVFNNYRSLQIEQRRALINYNEEAIKDWGHFIY